MNRREFVYGSLGLAGHSRSAAAPAVATVPLARTMVAVHTMVDMPEWAADAGKKWDAKAFVQACKAAHVEVIELKTKNAMGDAAFPFTDRPCLGDWTTETREWARREGMPFLAYYNVGLDNWMAKRRPDLCCVDAAGKPEIAFGAFNWMCLRSPWRDVVLKEIRQVAEAVRPDGFWFDLLGAPNAFEANSFEPGAACFCAHCRAAYRKAFGEEQPVASDNPEIRWRVNRFGHEARIAMLRDALDVLRAVDPAMIVGYNGAGMYDALGGTPREIRDRVGLHSTEAKPHRLISYAAKSMWAMGKPYQIHSYGGFLRMQPGSAVGTWSAWNLIPPAYMDISAAVVTAHSGRLSVGVNPFPDGTFSAAELSNLAHPFAAIREREPWLVGLESVPNLAVVYDVRSELVLLPKAADGAMRVRAEASGLHNALADAAMHFDVVSTEDFQPGRYAAILLADAFSAAPALHQMVRSYVEAGGLLIATNETSLRDEQGKRRPDFAWGDLFGVRFTGVSPFQEANYCWLGDELRGDAPAYPALFLTEVLEVACTTAKPLAELVYPEGHRTPERFTDGETPYTHFKQFTGKPLIAINTVGKGKVIYIAAPIGREISLREDPWLKRVVAVAVRKYAANLALDVQAPAGIQAVFGRKDHGKTHVVSLVNLYGGLALSSGLTAHPQVGPVKVSIPLPVFATRPKSVRPIDTHGMKWKIAGNALEVEMASIGHHAVLVIT
jgi:hypothetical protein